MFDWKKPTVQMLGRWQPWHKGHQELFKRCIKKTGQVVIQVRDVEGYLEALVKMIIPLAGKKFAKILKRISNQTVSKGEFISK